MLFVALARATEQRVRELDVQNLASTAWAFATAGQWVGELFTAIATTAERWMNELKRQNHNKPP